MMLVEFSVLPRRLVRWYRYKLSLRYRDGWEDGCVNILDR